MAEPWVAWGEAPTRAGSYELRASVAGTGSYPDLTGTSTFQVRRHDLTVTADDKATDYRTTPAALTYSQQGLQNDDPLGVTFVVEGLPGGVTTTTPAGSYVVSPMVTDAEALNNYAITLVDGTYHVLAPEVTVTAPDKVLTYDAAPHAIEVALGRNLPAGEATIYYSDTPFDPTADPSGHSTDPSEFTRTDAGERTVYWLVHAPNYTMVPVTGSTKITINPRPLTITAHPKDITYGEAPANDGVSYAGFAPGEDERFLSGTLAFTYDYAQGQDVASGSFRIFPGGLSNPNYAITNVSGTLTVHKLKAVFSWEPDTFVYDGAEHAVRAKVLNAYLAEDVRPASFAENQKTNVGAYVASVAGLTGAKAANYTFDADETSVRHAWTITQAPNTVTGAAVAGWTYDGTTHAAPVATAAFGQDTMRFEYSDRADFATTTDVPVHAGTYYMRAVVDETTNWAGAMSVAVPFTVERRSVTIAAKDQSRKYIEGLSHDMLFAEAGLSEPSAYTLSPEPIEGDSLGVTLDLAYPQVPAETGYGVGTYDITPAWNGNPDYEATIAKGAYRITDGDLSAIAEGWSGTYDARRHGISVTPTVDDRPARPDEATTYYATTPLDETNYATGTTDPLDASVTFADAGAYVVYYYVHSANRADLSGSKSVEIARAPLTVRADGKQTTYGQAAPTFTASYEGLVGGETAASLGLNATLTCSYRIGDDAGPYAIVPSGVDTPNYAASFAPGTLDVARALATFTWAGGPYTYDGASKSVSAAVVKAVATDDVKPLGYEGDRATDAGDYTARVTGLTGESAKNYSYESSEETASYAWSIRQAPNTVSVAIEGWTYGKRNDAISAPRPTADFGVDTVTYAYQRTAVFLQDGTLAPVSEDPTTTVPKDAGRYTVTATVPETNNWAGATATAEFTIDRARITISAHDAAHVYTPGITRDQMMSDLELWKSTAYKVEGDYVAGDPLGVSLGLDDVTYNVGKYTIYTNWRYNSNYDATCVDGWLYVTKADMTIKATGHTGEYDAEPHEIAVTATNRTAGEQSKVYYSEADFSQMQDAFTVEGRQWTIASAIAELNGSSADNTALVSGLEGALASYASELHYTNVGKKDVYFLVLSRNYNPDVIVGNRAVELTPAPLTATLADANLVYGDPAPTSVGVTYAGFKGADGEAQVTTPPAFAFSGYGVGSPAGTYEITGSGAATEHGNYVVSCVPATLTVARRAVQLSWAPKAGTSYTDPGDKSFAYTGASQGVEAAVSNLVTKAGAAAPDDVRIEDYSRDSAVSVGDYSAQALGLTGADASNYVLDTADPLTNESLPWRITRATNSWTQALSIEGWTYGTAPNAPTAHSTFGDAGVRYEYRLASDPGAAWSATPPTQAGDYVARATVAGTDDYTSLEATVPFSVAQAQIQITADDKGSGFGMDVAALTYHVTGGYVSGDDLGVTLGCYDASGLVDMQPLTPVGTYEIRVGWNSNPNYALQGGEAGGLVSGQYTVSRAHLDVTASDTAYTYDAKRHGIDVLVGQTYEEGGATTYYSTQELTSENFQTGTTDPLDESVSIKDVGQLEVFYYVDAPNYDAVPLRGRKTVVVNPAELVVTAGGAKVTFGEAPANGGVTYAGFIEGEGTSTGPEPGVLDGDVAYAFGKADPSGAIPAGSEYLPGSDVGTYAIVPSGLTGHNYAIRYVAGELAVEPREIKDDMLTVDPSAIAYDGKQKAPTVTLAWTDETGKAYTLVAGRDFDVSGEPSSAEFGTHELTVAGKGNYAGDLTRSWRVTGKRTEVTSAAIGDGEGILETDVLVDGITIEVDGLTVELLRSLMTPEELAEVEAGATGVLYLQVQRVDKLAEEDEDPTLAKLAELGAEPGLRLDVTLWKQVGAHAASRITDTGGPEVTITFDVPDDLASAPVGFERTFWGVRAHEGAATVLYGPSTDVRMVMGSNLFSGFTVGYRDEELPAGQGDGTLPAGPLEVIAARLAPTGDATPTVAVLAVALAGAGALAYGRRRRRDR